MLEYIIVQGNKNKSLIEYLNDPAYSDYQVVQILPAGSEYQMAYLQRKPTPITAEIVKPIKEEIVKHVRKSKSIK